MGTKLRLIGSLGKAVLAGCLHITPTSSTLSAPALSLDRIEIGYEGGSIVISPKDKDRFYHAIQERVPALKTDDNNGLIKN
ncbi:PH domain-containing protein [Acinetobacter baumannii]|uniref:PH domain-containing protein n=1 Tax=Acinetobacter baumannii TaxID=470 RepID=UPI00313A1B6E